MGSRSSYNRPHGKSRKRWSNGGKCGPRNKSDGDFRRFPLTDLDIEEVREVRRAMKLLKKMQRKVLKKCRESRLELFCREDPSEKLT